MTLSSSIIDPETRIGKAIVFLVVLILPMVAISGTLQVYTNVRRSVLFPPRTLTPYRFSYRVTIDMEDPAPYMIYVPTLLREDDEGPLQEILDIEFWEGNGDVSLIETEKGPALKIESVDSVELYFSRRSDEMDVSPIPGPTMSMMVGDNESEPAYHVYFEPEVDYIEAELSLRYTVNYRSSEPIREGGVTIDERLEIGWNIFKGRYYPP